MSSIEQPLERLNYFNGQRLEAADFRLEQDFHIRMRRWLNKSLFTWGIAAGLEVKVKDDDSHKVVVSPGMALDTEGREILLLHERELQVTGTPSETEGLVFGNYLVIYYAEEKTSEVDDGCALPAHDKADKSIAWGGPSRIRSQAVLHWQNNWPDKDSGKIVLAQVELDESCAVRDVHTTVRKYVGAAQAAKVRACTLEGEKDIDEDNPKRIYFHIEGGFPNDVLLYLRGLKFSTLYYTEMGQHNHDLSHDEAEKSHDFSHHHSVTTGETNEDGSHNHSLRVDSTDGDYTEAKPGVDIIADPEEDAAYHSGMMPEGGKHSHSFPDLQTNDKLGTWTHSHDVEISLGAAGTPDLAVRSGNSHKYIKDLQITFGGPGGDRDFTDEVLAQLRDRDGVGTWDKLGNGQSGHDLVTHGTQAIDVVRLGVDLSPGEHWIELSVPSGGGKIQYNFYVD